MFNVILFYRFNAVVSKTVNNHGDHAFSITGHTRHFYPIGHGIKINHYFPDKNHTGKYLYSSETEENPKEIVNRPVLETEESKLNNDRKMMFIEDGNVMILKPVEFEKKQEDNEISKPLVNDEETSVKVVPAVVSMLMHKPEKASEEMTFAAVKETAEDQIAEVVPKAEEAQKSNKEETTADSEVASSYYHSRIYYVGY